MDSFRQEPDDVKSILPGPSGLLLSRVTSAPEPRRHDGPFPSPFDLTPRKRDFPMDHLYQRSTTELSSPPARHFWPSAGSSPHHDDHTELPDKRPRLDYIQEREEGKPDVPRGRLDQYVCIARLHLSGDFICSSTDNTSIRSLATMFIRSSMSLLHKHPQTPAHFGLRWTLVQIATVQRAWLWIC
jgi:hypothetical protein